MSQPREQGAMNEPHVEELTTNAAERGLQVEEGTEPGQYILCRGDESVGEMTYVEQFDGWVAYDPTSPCDVVLDEVLSVHTPKKFVRRHSTFYVTFNYGRRKAPDAKPDGADEALLAALVKLAPVLAPGAVKVTVDGSPEPKWTKLG